MKGKAIAGPHGEEDIGAQRAAHKGAQKVVGSLLRQINSEKP
jgi:hypothetical protein